MKILYISTLSATINAFLVPHIQMLLELGHKVDIACNISRPINEILLERGCKIFTIEFQRSPLKKENYIAIKKLKKLIQDEKYDLVHTHTPVASACVRLACRKMKDVKVFYTAHGFHFFKGAPLKNWLIYYPIERWLARYTDVIITINKEDYNIAQGFKAKKVVYIPGVGVDVKKFGNMIVDSIKKRKELGILDDEFALLSVGELSKRKNHQVVINALAKLNNPNIKYFICGQGTLEEYLKDKAKDLNVNVNFLGFRKDISEICAATDLFILPSYQEGLPVSVMEAMAAGLPCIVSKVRGNVDLIDDGINGYLCDPNDIDGFAKTIGKVINDTELKKTMGRINIEKIKKYDKEIIKEEMRKIYCEHTNSLEKDRLGRCKYE